MSPKRDAAPEAQSGREAWIERLERDADGSLLRLLERDFPSLLPSWRDAVRRRDFLQLMGASLALAGLGSCTRQPDEKILAYARRPEEALPGKPRYFATGMELWGCGAGLLVESVDGRPIKVEGNPEHPGSLGATDAFAQAATLGLYDPDRSRTVLQAGLIRTFEDFHQELRAELGREDEDGRGVRFLTPMVASPSLAAELRSLLARWPAARWVQWEPLHQDGAWQATRRAFGRALSTRLRLDRAEVVLSLDADFLASGPGHLRYARDFALRRRVRADRQAMNRLYAVESSLSATGAAADHRLALRPSEIELFARALARELGAPLPELPLLPEPQARFLEALARDLRQKAQASLVVAGASASAELHLLALWMNRALSSLGRTIELTEPVPPEPAECAAGIAELCEEMRRGEVRALFVLGGNPAFDAPADCGFEEACQSVPFRVHLSLYEDETSRLCHWHLPQAHFLESWGDLVAYDGTLTAVQPLIAPLFDGRSALEVVADIGGRPMARGYELVRGHWRARLDLEGEDFERAWEQALHDGLLAESARPAIAPEWRGELELAPLAPATGLELVFRPDSSVLDGRFANLGWLQELPRVMTRLVWDTAALIAPATAAELGLESEQVVRLRVGERSIEAPIWIAPGHPQGSLTLPLGGGRRAGGRLGRGVGFDAYPLRSAASPGSARGATLERSLRRHLLVSVQDHRRMEGRDILRVRNLERFAEPRPAPAHPPEESSLYPPHESAGNAWGMVIDLGACIGCNACMIACQAENNVPVVGKDQVANGREMHWLRIDQYLEGLDDDPVVSHQPVPCMHCELAPCELVCPVGATVHSSEGLNDMVYNRCVGTRYCSNNCPYKVRRFNFLHYSKQEDPVQALGTNPEVTVRTRGVMEKCTYCVQRIQRVRIQSKLEDRAIQPGELQSACQQVCPTRAIHFGDVADPAWEVARLREEPHHYGLLAELGTRPRTTYLERFRNPNPELPGSGSGSGQ